MYCKAVTVKRSDCSFYHDSGNLDTFVFTDPPFTLITSVHFFVRRLSKMKAITAVTISVHIYTGIPLHKWGLNQKQCISTCAWLYCAPVCERSEGQETERKAYTSPRAEDIERETQKHSSDSRVKVWPPQRNPELQILSEWRHTAEHAENQVIRSFRAAWFWTPLTTALCHKLPSQDNYGRLNFSCILILCP